MSLRDRAVWHGVDETAGFEWTWIELLEFLSESWLYLALALIIHVPSTPTRIGPLQPHDSQAATPHPAVDSAPNGRRGCQMVVTPGQEYEASVLVTWTDPHHE